MGQNQSRALDRNLGVGTGGINAAQPMQDYRARNLVVTGDVAGGRGFRGSVGYRADDDFSAPTSEAATIEFRRGSAYSNPLALNTSIANDRFALATGIGSQQYLGDYAYTRMSAMGLTGVTLRSQGLDPGSMGAARARLDLMTVLSTNSASLAAASAPSSVRSVRVPQLGPSQVLVSPFTGVVLVPDGDPVETFAGSAFGGALMREDLRAGRVTRADYSKALTGRIGLASEAERRRDEAQLLGDARAADAGMARLGGVGSTGGRALGADSSVDARATLDLLRRPSAYDQVLDSVRQRYELVRPREPVGAAASGALGAGAGASGAQGQGAAGGVTPTPGVAPGQAGGAGAAEQGPDGTDVDSARRQSLSGAVRQLRERFMILPGTTRTDLSVPALPGQVPEPGQVNLAPGATEPEQPAGVRPLTVSETLEVLRHGTRVERLDAGSQDAMDRLLRLGSEFLAKGRYFRAEEAFRTATIISPSSPLPQLGIASAQVGGGVQLAAAITLRRLFVDFPEMIDVRLAPALQCEPARMREIAERCIREGKESSSASDFGLVAAWCGHQLADRALVEAGLGLMASAGDDGFVQTLRGIWLAAARPAP